ncbi:LysR substrate-binding domain-containing protein, partial [Streptomyces sp. NPDC006356]
ALARARHTVEEFLGRPDAEVSVAAFHSAGSAFFPLLLRALSGPGRPAPRLADEDVPQEDFPRLTREYDVVLGHRLDHAPPWPDTVATTTLLREPLDVAMPVDHPLAAKRRVTPRDVADEPWITVHDGFPVLAVIEAIAAAAGRRPHLAHRINEFAVVAEAVAAGGGIALIPRWTMRPHPALVLKPLSGVQARRHIDALYRPERTARTAVRTVLTELRHAARVIQNAGP